MTAEDTTPTIGAIFDAARDAQAKWALRPVRQRLRVLRRLRHLIAEHARELARSIVLPNRDSADSLVSEILPLCESIRFLEQHAARALRPKRWHRRNLPLWMSGLSVEIRREAIGLILIVAPGNYPLMLAGVQAIQALCAGNAVTIKPAPGHASVLHRLSELAAQAGLDAHLLSILPEGIESVREAVEALVDKIVVTGSSRTGSAIRSMLSSRGIPAIMELSGSDAVFVLPSADLELVADCLAFGLSFNGGATCIGPRRVFVPRHLLEIMERSLASRAERLGPFVIPPAIDDGCRALMSDAVRSGARVVCAPGASGKNWSRPLILSEITSDLTVAREDPFAPVLCLIPVANEEEALERDRACAYALGASVFGDLAEARRFASRIEAGLVTINDLVAPLGDPRLPLAPRGQSGFGVTRGIEGLLEMTCIKAISIRHGFRPHLLPRRDDEHTVIEHYIRASHGASWSHRLGALRNLAQIVAKRGKRK